MAVGEQRSIAEWWALIKSAVAAWIDDYAPSMGAALSYYTIFSLAPLLLIVIAIAGLFFGADAVRGEIFGQLRGLMGDDAARAVEGILASVSKPSEGIAASVIGVIVLLIGATAVFGELQDALDRIWRAPVRHKASGPWGFVQTRLLSFGMIFGIAFLLIVSLVLGAVMAALGKWWGGAFGGWALLAQCINTLVGFVLTTVVFAMIYKYMPRVRVRWDDVWLGAGHRGALYRRQISDRDLHRQEWRGVRIRRRRFARNYPDLGLLFGADFSDRRGIHLGLRAHFRLPARSAECVRSRSGK